MTSGVIEQAQCLELPSYGMLSSVLAWLVMYVAFLAMFVVLGLSDPDSERRAVVWPMAGSFGGLAALAVARTLSTDGPLGSGPWIACWLVVAALIASAGRPIRLAIGTPLDPKLGEITVQERHSARRARLLTLLTFVLGIAVAALLRPDLFEI